MTQEERWLAKYNEVVEFIENNHRNPSRYRIEEHDMLNWVKANRKNECRENTSLPGDRPLTSPCELAHL